MGVAIAWIIFSVLIIVFAGSKGRSGCGWFILSLIISPLLAFIILACLGDTDEKRAENIKAAMDVVNEKQQADKKATEDESEGEMTEKKAIEELKKAKDLLDLEVITKEEYEAKKAELSQYINK